MKNIKRILAVQISLMIVFSVNAGSPEEGKVIFNSRCGSCHNVNKALTGPALAGVEDRHPVDWIVSFVQSSQSLIKKGDKDAVALYQRFNGVNMPDHPDLTSDNIKSVLAYIKSATVAEDAAPFAKPDLLKAPYRPLSITKDFPFFLLYFAAVVMLIGVLLFCVRMKELSQPLTLKNSR